MPLAADSSIRSWQDLARIVSGRGSAGQHRFFADQSYHFQTLRALNDAVADGAEPGEVLQTVRHVRAGDADSWFEAWEHTAQRVLQRAQTARDPLSRGRAFLRVHNYLRTAEFFLAPQDPRRLTAFRANVASFEQGLDALGVRRERLRIPYGDGELGAIYYPAAMGGRRRPLLMFCGGIDSTLEELYFMLVRAAHERGYAVLTYEGPGQGSALREHHLNFVPDWERPTGAVLDAFLAGHATPQWMVLLGMSMGGLLAPRAAAFDRRFDGVVAFDVMFDLGAIARRMVPSLALRLHARGIEFPIDALVAFKRACSPAFRWAVDNGCWVFGTGGPMQTLDAMRAYTLEGIGERLHGDVLILAGERDHFVPLAQLEQFRASLTQARSVTVRLYDEASGGGEHCQMGAMSLWHADLFSWLHERFPPTA